MVSCRSHHLCWACQCSSAGTAQNCTLVALPPPPRRPACMRHLVEARPRPAPHWARPAAACSCCPPAHGASTGAEPSPRWPRCPAPALVRRAAPRCGVLATASLRVCPTDHADPLQHACQSTVGCHVVVVDKLMLSPCACTCLQTRWPRCRWQAAPACAPRRRSAWQPFTTCFPCQAAAPLLPTL